MEAEESSCTYAFLQGSREGGPSSYIELKTSRIIYTDRNKYNFKRFVTYMHV